MIATILNWKGHMGLLFMLCHIKLSVKLADYESLRLRGHGSFSCAYINVILFGD
jgi:hypothetical protein